MKECNSLQEIRNQIDILDEKIVNLIAQRNSYIKQMAKFKTSVDEVKSPDRIDEVINHVRAVAIKNNLNPNTITDLYMRMIDMMVESEIVELKNAQKF